MLDITGLAGGGRGVARTGGKVVFVAGALPGERVEAEVERERAGIIEARVVRVLQASPARESSPCPRAGECGGCDMAHLARAAAPDALRAVAAGGLRHAPPRLAEMIAVAPVELSPWGYRLRARLHWDREAGRLGLLGPRSRRVVDIDPCRVLSPRLLALRPALTRLLAGAAFPDGDLEWLEPLDGRHGVAGWWAGAELAPRRLGGRRRPQDEDPTRRPSLPDGGRFEALVAALEAEAIAGLAGFHRLSSDGPVQGWGANAVRMELPRPLDVPVGAFFQGNRFLVPRLFDRVTAIAAGVGPTRCIDLFAGVGFLAAAAGAAGCADLTVVEGQPAAAVAAAANLPEARVLEMSAEAFLAAPGPAEGTLAVLDPPRAGLSRGARAAIAAWRPSAVLVLGCEPATFGRDATALMDAGLEPRLVELWDLFAGSHHAEILALFTR